jgi:hypothetical protein
VHKWGIRHNYTGDELPTQSVTGNSSHQNVVLPGILHFQEDAAVIKESLSHVLAAELHFYWTSGREDMRKEDLQPVHVGGAHYGDIFHQYVAALLSNSPDHLKVKFVCDTATQRSNQKWISFLQDQYDQRFECLPVAGIKVSLLGAFPEQKELIELIFKNATGGNPAIPSDTYRLIGMVYGRNLEPEEVYQTQYTYCDIDTFCAGMDVPNEETQRYYDYGSCSLKNKLVAANGHTNLIRALFSKPTWKEVKPVKESFFRDPIHDPSTTFYLGKHLDNDGNSNDLIKIQIKNLSSYKGFCEEVLFKIDFQNQKKRCGQFDVLTYFPTLYSYIRGCELDLEASFRDYLDHFSNPNFQVNDIIEVTGPDLTKELEKCFPLIQVYPMICTWEWHGTQLIEFGSKALEGVNCEKSKTWSQVAKEFSLYASRVSDAFFAKRFGTQHPFNVKMIEYLQTHFPFTTSSFKALMKESYVYEKEKGNTHTDSEENWLVSQIDRLTKRQEVQEVTTHDTYCIKLMHLLDQLGIQIALTPGSINFRK